MKWQPAETAPKNKSIIGDFDYGWAMATIWSTANAQWAVAILQMSYVDGKEDPYYETDYFEAHELKRWMPEMAEE